MYWRNDFVADAGGAWCVLVAARTCLLAILDARAGLDCFPLVLSSVGVAVTSQLVFSGDLAGYIIARYGKAHEQNHKPNQKLNVRYRLRLVVFFPAITILVVHPCSFNTHKA